MERQMNGRLLRRRWHILILMIMEESSLNNLREVLISLDVYLKIMRLEQYSQNMTVIIQEHYNMNNFPKVLWTLISADYHQN